MPQETRTPPKSRDLSMDILRAFACFLVVLLHVAANKWSEIPPAESGWKAVNFYDSLSRSCVPLFVMISGVFMLGRDIEIGTLYRKNILRLATAYVFWAVAYAVGGALLSGESFSIETAKNVLQAAISGHYHLWFVPMLIGVYMFVPLLRPMAKRGKKLCGYAVLLFFLVKIVFTTMSIFEFPGAYWVRVLLLKLPMTSMDYTGYFIFGYYLYNHPPKTTVRNIIYALGAVSVGLAFCVTNLYSATAPKAMLYDYFSATTFFEAAALFLLARQLFGKVKFSERAAKIITEISACTFGAYLIHDAVRGGLQRLGLDAVTLNPWAAIPLAALAAFVISIFAAWIIRKIPLSKYIA